VLVERYEDPLLQLRHSAALSGEDSARIFRASTAAAARWEVEANPVSQAVGSLVEARPPVRRYNDTVHHLTRTLAGLGFGGYGKRSASTSPAPDGRSPRPPSGAT
jgi:hypothetical protein